MVFIAFVRWRVATTPLERDEGEYAYTGQLILQGIPPYRLAYNMKFPGTYYAYSLILALFGPSIRAIRIGLLLVNVASIWLVFLIGRRLFGAFPAALAAASFALLSLDRWILGVFAHATHFVLLPVLGGLLLLLQALDGGRRKAFFISGTLLGLAVLMKQHAVFYLPFAAGLVAWHALREKAWDLRKTAIRLALVGLGSAVPLLVVCTILLLQGVFGAFWFWTFRYAGSYVSQVDIRTGLALLGASLRAVTSSTLGLWIAGGLGLVLLVARRWNASARVFLGGLLAASFLAICPGFYFRPHYFILLLPSLALLTGVAATFTRDSLRRVVSPGIAGALTTAAFLVPAGAYVARERSYLFSMTPRDLSRISYGSNPFIESVELARYIQERTSPGASIAVLGSEPQIFFYAGRNSATSYIYMYPLTEPQRYARMMQVEMIRQVEEAHAEFLVFVKIDTSWIIQTQEGQQLVEWASRHVEACYDLVGIADIYSLNRTRYVWHEDVWNYRPASNNLALTYRRRSSAPCRAPHPVTAAPSPPAGSD